MDIWDKGTFEIEGAESAASQIEKGDLKFTLKGDRLNGRYALVKMRNASRGNEWLFIRKSDPCDRRGGEAENGSGHTAKMEDAAAASKTHDPATLEGSKKAPFPSDVPVALAQLSEKPFSDPAWLFEIKVGWRARACVCARRESRTSSALREKYHVGISGTEEHRQTIERTSSHRGWRSRSARQRRPIGLHANTAEIRRR